MASLTRVVQRRCERRDCDRFGMTVDAGEVCPDCGSRLAIKTALQPWVPLAGAAVLGLVALGVLLLRYRPAAPQGTGTSETPSRFVSEPARPASSASSTISSIADGGQGVSQGEQLASQGRYQEARLEFLRATEADPGNAVAWIDLGAADSVTGRIEEARAAYDKALALDPDHWQAHYNLALLLAREGDRDGAVRHLERFFQAVGTRPDKRQAAIADLRGDPSVRGLLEDPRIRALTGL